MSAMPPSLWSRRILRACEIAGIDPSARSLVVLSLVAIVLIAFFAEGASALLDIIAQRLVTEEWQSPAIAVLKIAPLLAFMSWVYLRARSAEERAVPVASETKGPAACRVLVIFLSRPGVDAQLVRSVLDEEAAAGIEAHAFRSRFQGGWRMSLEAIHHHLPALERVIVVPSADTERSDATTDVGTQADAETFVSLASKLLASQHSKIVVESLADALGDKALSTGVEFGRLQPLMDAFNRIILEVRERHGRGQYARSDFRIDITGGMKTASAAATAFALAMEVPLQYVNTNDYSVWGFEIAFAEQDT